MKEICRARLDVPEGTRKTQHQGGGATEYSSNNSAPTLASHINGTLFFIKRSELHYQCIEHKSSAHLILLGRLIESLFAYRWREKIRLHDERFRFGSLRTVFIERLSSSLVVLTDLCESERPRVAIPINALVILLDAIELASLSWFTKGASPENIIIDVDSDFAITIRAFSLTEDTLSIFQ